MRYAQWNEMAEAHLLELGLTKDEVEPLLRQRIDANACEPYGPRGRLRTVIKVRKKGKFGVEFCVLDRTPWIQAVYEEQES